MLFQQYYEGFLLQARFDLLRTFAGLLYLTQSSCLQQRIKIKDPRKIKRSDDRRTYDVKSQFAGFYFFLNH